MAYIEWSQAAQHDLVGLKKAWPPALDAQGTLNHQNFSVDMSEDTGNSHTLWGLHGDAGVDRPLDPQLPVCDSPITTCDFYAYAFNIEGMTASHWREAPVYFLKPYNFFCFL